MTGQQQTLVAGVEDDDESYDDLKPQNAQEERLGMLVQQLVSEGPKAITRERMQRFKAAVQTQVFGINAAPELHVPMPTRARSRETSGRRRRRAETRSRSGDSGDREPPPADVARQARASRRGDAR